MTTIALPSANPFGLSAITRRAPEPGANLSDQTKRRLLMSTMVAVSVATSLCAWLSHGRDVTVAAGAVRQAVALETTVLAKHLSGHFDMPAWWITPPRPVASGVIERWVTVEAPAPTPVPPQAAAPQSAPVAQQQSAAEPSPIPSAPPVPAVVALAAPQPVASEPAAPIPADVPLPVPAPAMASSGIPASVPVPPMRPMGLRGAAARVPAELIPVPRHDSAPTVARSVRTAPPTVQAASASPDTRNFLEKLFGMGRPAAGALGYAAAEGGAIGGGGGTAVYDISTHTVTLPDGRKLEAHSGLGNLIDDPSHVNQPMRGSTPPHVYDLSMRESIFHGVQALRLTPVGGGGVYGRSGLLAHSYMLGPNGDSNGCVSFKDYATFLRAYQSGQIRRLEVVARAS